MATSPLDLRVTDGLPYHSSALSRRPGVRAFTGIERVRHELLTALHFGKLKPGDRVPSVRRLADQTGMNRKTVHRAYRRLAEEGLLVLQPGSGTFVAESLSGSRDPTSVSEILRAANRFRASAETLGIPPEKFLSFLHVYLGGRLREVSLAVTECNHEQLTLVEAGLRGQLGVRTRPVLLSELSARPAAALRGLHGVVTTDCHRAEVAEITASLDVPVYRVALDPRFPRRLLERACDSTVIMLVRDPQFIPVFLRLLRHIAAPEPLPEGIHILEASKLSEVADRTPGRAWVYVSPLVREQTEFRLPHRFRRVRSEWAIEPGSLDRLRARLSLDLVSAGEKPRRLVAG